MRAMIVGVSGQDGAYLAQYLLEKGYEVTGTSRDASRQNFASLQALGIRDRLRLVSLDLTDFEAVRRALREFDSGEVYCLSGQSSVSRSFDDPVETFHSITIGMVNLLHAARLHAGALRIFNACSGDCFGDTGGLAADEGTPFKPGSPYAVAKAAAFWAVASQRQAYGLHVSSGILFNHESPLRPPGFVTRKIVDGACAIFLGSREPLHLGNLAIVRDWGWAPEYVQAIWLMLQQPEAGDYVIATGHSHSLETFVSACFELLGLDWRQWVVADPSLLRPSDHLIGRAHPAKAAERLGWTARSDMHRVARQLVQAELERRGVSHRVS